MRPALHIAPLLALPADIEELRIEAAGEGFRFVDKLITEWHSGTNRFAQAGEIFLGACRSDELIAIGGLNRDPYAGQAWIGRLRHLYVRKSERRSGVGSTLVRQLLRHAEGIFHLVRLRTGTREAAAFYVGLGFCPVQDKAATHVMLRRQSLGPSVQNLDLCSEGSSDLERRFASGGLSQLRANTRRIRT